MTKPMYIMLLTTRPLDYPVEEPGVNYGRNEEENMVRSPCGEECREVGEW